MILHRITIQAAPDNKPAALSQYAWQVGDDPEHLQILIDKLQEYVKNRKDQLRTALASSKPLEHPIT